MCFIKEKYCGFSQNISISVGFAVLVCAEKKNCVILIQIKCRESTDDPDCWRYNMYDYLIVGAGPYGSVMARELTNAGKTCLVIDKRNHIGGNVYTEEVEGIQVHRYGAHIFHTSDEEVWEYVNRFAKFNHYINAPVAVSGDEVYNLPFNMNTFSRLWNIRTPQEARDIIDRQIKEAGIAEPANLEEQALSLCGRDIYEKLIKGYTQKQWGRPCCELPSFIIRRLPFRFTYDNNYFNDPYQGIPKDGYTAMIDAMLDGIEVRLDTDFFSDREAYMKCADHVIFTGMIDEFFDYCYGELEYRSLRFESETLDTDNYQGNAVVNFTDADIPYTRMIEHKHFVFGKQEKTVVTREYPSEWKRGMEPYYPINDEKNGDLYRKYDALAKEQTKVTFGGRLGAYQYYDMDKVIRAALDRSRELLR